MSKELENLSKDLANGMSRRKALLRLATATGLAGIGLLTTAKKAKADDHCDWGATGIENWSESWELCLEANAENDDPSFNATIFCFGVANCFYDACLQHERDKHHGDYAYECSYCPEGQELEWSYRGPECRDRHH